MGGGCSCCCLPLRPASPRAPLRLRRGSSYGIQDDAWLEFGPGDARPAAGDVQAARCAARPLHAPLERDRPAAAEERDLAARSRLRLASSGQGSARPSPPRSDAGAHAGRDAGMGERGPFAERTPRRGPGTSAASRTAAAKRYPWVRYWLIWNEPNKHLWLRPTKSPIYVQHLLNPGYEAIHAVLPHARVGGGVTAPRGGLGGIAPGAWIRGMFRAHAKLDAYAHHPYPSTPSETPSSGGCRTCPAITMATIRKLLVLVKRYFGPKPIWLTEYGYQSNPPDTFLGVPLKRQATMVSLARDARVEAATGHDADPVPLPRRARAQPLPDRARLRERPRRSPRCRDSSCRSRRCARHGSRDSRLGSDPRRTARAEAVPAGGAPEERVEGASATTG